MGTKMAVIAPPISEAQRLFNETYITATEISREVSVSRVSVLRARQRGFLPDAITVGEQHVCIWERAKVQPAIDAWKLILACRPGRKE